MSETEYLQYTFSPDELKDIAGQLARRNTEAAELEERKKQVVTDFGAQITASKAEISRLSRLYCNGYEYRNIDCEVRLNDPASGRATIIRTDTGEVVRVRSMTLEEMQDVLPLEPTREPEAAPEPPAPVNGHDACADGTCGHIPEWRTVEEIAAGVPLVPVPEDPPEWVKPKGKRQ